EPDEGKREVAKVLLPALKPTARAGTIDVGVDLRGPSKKGLYTVIAAGRVVEGEGIEQAIKKVLAKLPEEAKAPITMDVDKAGGANIHRIMPEKGKVDKGTRELFGEGPIYFAVRTDALFVSFGEGALAAM